MKLLPNHGPWCSASKKFLKREGDVIVPIRMTTDFAVDMFMSGLPCHLEWIGLQGLPDGTCALVVRECQGQQNTPQSLMDVPFVRSVMFKAYDLLKAVSDNAAVVPFEVRTSADAFYEELQSHGLANDD